MSLLSHVSKILEKLFDSRLQKFIDKCKLLSNNQYGFRSECLSLLALLEFIESICSDFDENNNRGVHRPKHAFDTIKHELLLQKLDFYGITGSVNN